jgi:hypothetical protein
MAKVGSSLVKVLKSSFQTFLKQSWMGPATENFIQQRRKSVVRWERRSGANSSSWMLYSA